MAAEQVGGLVTDPALGADLVRVEASRGPSRVGGAEEAVGHQLVRVFGAKARVGRIPAPARGADHSLGKWPGRAPIAEGRAVADAEAVPWRVLRETDRAASDGWPVLRRGLG